MNVHRSPRAARHQSGSVLITSTILLIVLTLIVLSVIKSTTVNSRVAGNLQTQQEAEAAAQQAIEAVVASNFPDAPLASTAEVNVSNAGPSSIVGKYTVAVAKPQCLVVVPIKSSDLDVVGSTDDIGCLISNSDPRAGSTNDDSVCATRQWDIQATATPANGGGPGAVVYQGVADRVVAGTTCAP